jgi:hypothetical protein
MPLKRLKSLVSLALGTIKWSQFTIQLDSLPTDYVMLYSPTQAEPSNQNMRILTPVLLGLGFSTLNYSTDQVLTSIVGLTYLNPSTNGLTVKLPNMSEVTNQLYSTVSFQNISSFYTQLINNVSEDVIDTLMPSEVSNLLLESLSTADGDFAIIKEYLPLSEQGIDLFPNIQPATVNPDIKGVMTGGVHGNTATIYQFSDSGFTYVSSSFCVAPRVGQTNYGVKLAWNVNSTATGNVVWYVQAVYRNPLDPFDIAFGTPISINSAATGTATQTIITPISSPIIPAGAGFGMRFVEFRLYRDGGGTGDTLADTANLLGFMAFLNYIAANDLGAT